MAEGRALAAVLLAAAALAVGCGGEEEQASAPPPVAAGSIALDELERCGGDAPPRLRCGELTVPYERAEPSLGRIGIAFAVRPADDRDPESPRALVAVEGGPGYGSIGSARDYIATFGDLLRDRDLVLVDARGTGGSEPVDCPDMQSSRSTDDIGVAACAERLGERYGSYRTAAAADDIDDVLTALGYGPVQMYGDSYGTYLAQSYAFRHGERLRALVLDSAFPVRGESPWYEGNWRTGIRGLSIACDRSPDCHGDAGRRLERFVTGLRESTMDPGPILDAIAAAGYSPPESYLRIDRAIADYLGGDSDRYSELVAGWRARYGKPGGYSVGEELAVSCNDYPMPWDKDASWEERRRQLGDAIDGLSPEAFAPFTAAEVALAPDWMYLECLGAPPPGPLYERPAERDAAAPEVPVLVVAGELDNITSPPEARAVAADFPNAELFLWRNAGHVQSLYDPRSEGAVRIRRFLRENDGG
ncbi:MAG: alpha/beta fold hydrolase [Thermoleophilia bacterium]|nr:alpha/beta fold hydrolase [Thermoleophilia bacterium]GIK77960.1 MAG: cysteine proteinase [Actinomycetes bacterium]